VKAPDDLVGVLRGGRSGLWTRLWFGESSLVRLAVFRIVVLVTALFALRFHYKALVQDDGASEFVTRRFVPLYFLELLGLGPMPPAVAHALYVVLLSVLLLAIAGLWTRLACLAAAVGMLLWVGTAYSYGQPHHEYGMLAFALLALPLGPVGARLSVDSWLARRREAKRHRRRLVAPVEGEDALLPIRFTQLSVALGYLFAGASKLSIGGTEWLNGYTLQGFMLEFDAPLTDALASNLLVLRLMSWGVILIQVLSFLAVVWRPLRWVFVPGIVGLHLGSMVAIDTGTFLGLWLMQIAFVDGERVPAFLRRRIGAGNVVRRALWLAAVLFAAWWLVVFYLEKGPAFVPWLFLPVAIAGLLGLLESARVDLVYDGGCGICTRTMALVDALNWSGRVRVLSTSDWDEVARLHPTLEREACLRDVHLVDRRGRVSRGFDAYRALAWRLPLTVLVAPLLRLPGVSALGERVYRHVADGRATESCGLPRSE